VPGGATGGRGPRSQGVVPPQAGRPRDKRKQEELIAEIDRLKEQEELTQGGNVQDVYPPLFWPQLPWEKEPEDIYERRKRARHDLTPEEVEKGKREDDDIFVQTKPMKSDDDPEEHRWHGARVLGRGTFGRAGLWVKTDDNNNIIDVSEVVSI
jgi:hypothetical protein